MRIRSYAGGCGAEVTGVQLARLSDVEFEDLQRRLMHGITLAGTPLG